ncbi:hypothetical protein CGLO_15704 [Colletotrichum gloeosporioides Cg-14]|uniref:Peptidase M48 domain-containing protein n=1 Tax=Colletotrichum gloeosporioides (strain Cg-14) TaxID=1237896 RepID=T0JY94_COLGC|nr:hypothetical protein CGLO_15704 [Colletotrichum gloeosporioides Cg-14]
MSSLLRALRPPASRAACLRPPPPRPLHGNSPISSRLAQIRSDSATPIHRQTRPFSQTPRAPQDPRDPRRQIDYDYLQRQYHENRIRAAKPLWSGKSDGRIGIFERFRRAATSRGTVGTGVIAGSFLAAVLFYFYNLQTVPVSGRKRFNIFPEDYVKDISAEQVRRIIHEVESQGGRFLPSWDPRARMVKRVMERLIPVSGMEDLQWEIRVIDDPSTINAFVLPGGKVFVHSGILRVTKNEDGLAAVLGHEIAHIIADHVGERMSSLIGPNILLGALFSIWLATPLALPMVHYLGGGLIDFIFTLPMGRLQESEADYIGMMLMAEACYDPSEAIGLWQRMDRMAKMYRQDEIPEILGTHPSNEHRIQKCTEWLPKALEKRSASDCQGTASFAGQFRRALDLGNLIIEF